MSLDDDLARCDREIEQKLLEVMEFVDPGGAYLGLHDWRTERRLIMAEIQKKQELVTFPSGASSSKIPRFDLIPYRALCRLAARFELGVERHQERAWNARSSQVPLSDREFVIQRAAHAMHHAAKLIAKLEGRIPDDGDDDAAAIMWSGSFLCEATERPAASTEPPSPAAAPAESSTATETGSQ